MSGRLGRPAVVPHSDIVMTVTPCSCLWLRYRQRLLSPAERWALQGVAWSSDTSKANQAVKPNRHHILNGDSF